MTKRKHKYSGRKLSRGEPPNFSGQHLMHNKKLLYEIVDRAKVGGEDTVLELGAGKGALTTVLNQQAKKVLAVEYDARFVEILKEKTANQPNTIVIHQDIMKIRLPKEKFIVVSNIPYSITTPIMKLLLNNPASGLQRGIIIMEKGAARRFTAKFMKNSYVLVWKMWFDIRFVKAISRDDFSPPPSVDSAMVMITRKRAPVLPQKGYSVFLGLAEYALKQPESPIEFAFRGIFTPPQMKLLRRKLNIENEKPVGTLNEEQWGIVYQTMVQYVPYHKWPRVKR
ncbi:23S ribosomal RNA methyltransferase Erm [Paenibacillus macerans]|uniref:rRNA adenine N-6-methyltransferase n=1 Tax=Paenibacillus macerans TaxID=44252 RepID=A0A090ZBU1_PAEMA|nr:23S ribosomal RNA methyltransferase Erm [Paenibacillus macerans]KFN08759.1 methyltransferase small domain protein [Paenibacillus macerans]MBS5912204.1 23S ribosomal RNA methyltransferase Erm [Paenibacillus macerans]MCY7562115.1 23S ribosomal RNA methyltransferase Erm [Paenibacillus macerans]MDU5947842.1 23S ribosomal RNA methyltransferase Erm [Paenibacillus macerans]MEC0140102.1 23S ribosomal RNA methyltransferase Erm [Paenibacillus macerans]